MATSKLKVDCGIVHSNYDGVAVLQVNGNTYYDLFTLDAGVWEIFVTMYMASGIAVICHGNSIDNTIAEANFGGASAVGVVKFDTPTTVQMFVTANTTINRFKAEAVRIA